MANASNRYALSTFLMLSVLSSLLVGGVLSKKLVDTHHTIDVSSLLPSPSCKPSPTKSGGPGTATLKVVHKHGPCNSLNGGRGWRQPDHADILQEDLSRVDWINSRLTSKTAPASTGPGNPRESKTTVIPAKLGGGKSLGSGNYLVTLGLGTPSQQVTMMFDTATELSWTLCKPCAYYCHKQEQPIYDSTVSTTYLNISCDSSDCPQLLATGILPKCSASTCVYSVRYADETHSTGFFAKDTLTISGDAVDDFRFGCGQNNWAAFAGAAGVLGLGQGNGNLSFVEQSAAKYGRYFSNCLAASLSSTGHLTFGHGDRGSGVMWTPVLNVSEAAPLYGDYENASFYGVALESITVGGQKLSIPASIFSDAQTIIDTGTMITRLPPTAYNALKNAFKGKMTTFPPAPALSMLDTCYDMSQSKTARIPSVGFSFRNKTNVELDQSGIIYVANASRACLAFAANRYDTDVIVYGSVQMQTFEVVYDLDRAEDRRIGFLAKGCK